jgi:hypothetical protein
VSCTFYPSQLPWFNHPDETEWRVWILKLSSPFLRLANWNLHFKMPKLVLCSFSGKETK